MVVVELHRELGLEGGVWKSVRALLSLLPIPFSLEWAMLFGGYCAHKMVDKCTMFSTLICQTAEGPGRVPWNEAFVVSELQLYFRGFLLWDM